MWVALAQICGTVGALHSLKQLWMWRMALWKNGVVHFHDCCREGSWRVCISCALQGEDVCVHVSSLVQPTVQRKKHTPATQARGTRSGDISHTTACTGPGANRRVVPSSECGICQSHLCLSQTNGRWPYLVEFVGPKNEEKIRDHSKAKKTGEELSFFEVLRNPMA